MLKRIEKALGLIELSPRFPELYAFALIMTLGVGFACGFIPSVGSPIINGIIGMVISLGLLIGAFQKKRWRRVITIAVAVGLGMGLLIFATVPEPGLRMPISIGAVMALFAALISWVSATD